MKSIFRTILGAALLTFLLGACNPRKTGGNESQKSAQPPQTAEPAAPVEDEITKLRRLAGQGEATAQLKLGDCYADGEGVSKDEVEAVKWYRMAAGQGNAEALFNLGFSYARGNGVSKDETEAVKWYKMAAERGNAIAQRDLGYCYANGEGVSKNETEAVKWYRMAAEPQR